MRIFVDALNVSMKIGVYEHEHLAEQPVVVSLVAEVDEPPNPRSDRLEDWVDYDRAIGIVRTLAGRGHVSLLETLAHAVADEIMRDPRIKSLRIRLEKPDACPGAKSVGVELTRSRGQ